MLAKYKITNYNIQKVHRRKIKMKNNFLKYNTQYLTSNRAITLVTLVLTIVLILLVSGTMGYYTKSGLELQKVNNMYSDIEQIQSKIDEYYIKNNELPVIKDLEKINFLHSSNVNDNENYYIIDLSKLGNISLNYGRDFEKIKSSNTLGTDTDIYIINEQTHTIYYLEGIKYEDKIYYTKPVEYTEIID